ncbi:MAG: hypothetical protein IKY10_00140 [Clostridia bacterium]|nr:hypothetical protein [Clostridia bacterium]
MKKLEFNIVDNKRLDVLDFSWYISEINAIYISHSKWNSKINPNYAIYILSNSDLVELYYKTNDEIKISNCFKDLCSAIKEVNPNFEMCFPYCVNTNKIIDFDFNKNILTGEIKVVFDGAEIEIKTIKKNAKKFIESLESKINASIKEQI